MKDYSKEPTSLQEIVKVFTDPLNKRIQKLELENKALKEQLILSGVSNRRELLPDFLYKDDYGIKIGYQGDTEVSKEWNEYLEKLGNCG